MNKCVFCKKENDLFNLEMSHLEEDLGPGVIYKVCGTCWEAIFEIALKAVDLRIEEKEKVEAYLLSKHKLKVREKETITAAKTVFVAILKLSKDDLYIKASLEGSKYIWMHNIREAANDHLLSNNQDILSPQSISVIIRTVLKFEVGKRQGVGIPVYLDSKKIVDLSAYFKTSAQV